MITRRPALDSVAIGTGHVVGSLLLGCGEEQDWAKVIRGWLGLAEQLSKLLGFGMGFVRSSFDSDRSSFEIVFCRQA